LRGQVVSGFSALGPVFAPGVKHVGVALDPDAGLEVVMPGFAAGASG